MPKIGNTEIYNDDNNITFNDRVIGTDADANGRTKNYRVGDIAQLILSQFGQAYSNTVITGGVTWLENLTYEVSDLTYFLDSVFYTAQGTQITLDPADSDNPRIDLIVVDVNGLINRITGTPSPSPVKPELPLGLLEVSFVLIEANATQPQSIVEVIVYNENLGSPSEWITSQINTLGFDFVDTTNPFRDINAISFTHANGETNRSLQLSDANGLLSSDYSTLHFYIKLDAVLDASDVIRIALADNQDTSNELLLANGSFGIDFNNTISYQSIIIPLNAFLNIPFNIETISFNLSDTIDTTFLIDYIRLIGGINNTSLFNTFLSLLDTPSDYTGKARRAALVNEAENSIILERIPRFDDIYGTNAIITGGVVHITGLTYRVWATSYIVNNIPYFDQPISDEVILDSADPTNPRIDVFAIFNDGNDSFGATVIKGIPDPSPVKPNLENTTQVEVSFKLLQSSETTPPEIINTTVYDENLGAPTEWANILVPNNSNSSANTNPITGSVYYDLGVDQSRRFLSFGTVAPITYDNNGVLIFKIRTLQTNWLNGERLSVRIGNGSEISNYISITNRTASNFNFNLSNDQAQDCFIPLSAFVFGSDEITKIEFRIDLQSNVHLDEIYFQTGQENPSINLLPEYRLNSSGNIINLTRDGVTVSSIVISVTGDVQSITGDGVDNTDPNNPVLNFPTPAAISAIPTSEKGVANGVATLNGSGQVPSSQLPSFVDDVLEYPDRPSFPPTGEDGKIYVAEDTNISYRWTGSVYVKINDLSAPEVKTLYESNADTNAFTDDEKNKVADRLNTQASVTGVFNLDLAAYEAWKLTLVGPTTLTETNLPASGFTKPYLLKVTGDFAITYPAGWSTDITGTYDGTVNNTIVVWYIGAGEYKVQITQPD